MGYNEWSDDENTPRTHGRDKFRHERSLERDRYGGEEYDRYDRKKRARHSPSPTEDRRHKRRPSYSPPPMRNFHNHRVRDYRNDPDTEHYIPNYERDGYTPAPRYGSKPEPTPSSSFTPHNNSGGYPPMEMMNPQFMNQGWNNNTGRYPLVDPAQLDYLVPFKQFSEFVKRSSNRRVDDEDMQKRFAQYKENFAARQLAQFFTANKEKEWFQEKYHPIVSRPRQEDVKERRRGYLNEFLEALKKGEYDQVLYDKDAQSSNNTETNDEEEPETIETPVDDVDYDIRLVIKTVPPTIARDKIMEMCKKVEGFEYLALSEPSPNKKFHRIGWIKFKEGTDIKKSFEQLDNQKVDDFVFHLAMNRKNSTQSRVPRIAPYIANSTERLQKDLEQARELAVALEAMLGDDLPEGLKLVEAQAQKVIDSQVQPKKEETEEEKGLVEEEDVERRNLKKRLDMIIAYLRHVHMYCYYCAVECDSIEDLSRRCCDPHCRTISNTTHDESTDPKQVLKNERGAAQWLKNLDHRISLKIHTPDDRELQRIGGKVIQTEIDNYIKEHVNKEHDTKYKCQVGECSKAFKGYDYVEKHILAKHPEEIESIKAEVEYYNNYVCDPNHIIPNTNNNTNYLNQNMMPVANMPFMPNNPFMMNPQNMQMMPNAMSPWEQMPPMNFGMTPPHHHQGWNNAPRRPTRVTPNNAAYMDLENSLPRDPRQVTSYVDLDAPAEGDSNIAFY